MATAVVLSASLGALAKHALDGRLLWNFTTSIAPGAYWIAPVERVERGELVALPIPESVRMLVYERGYVPRSIRLLAKPIAALEGDYVCVQNDQLVINGLSAGVVLQTDSRGQGLPQHSICRRLGAGEVFLATDHANSFDSRNFGPVSVDSLRGTLKPLLTF